MVNKPSAMMLTLGLMLAAAGCPGGESGTSGSTGGEGDGGGSATEPASSVSDLRLVNQSSTSVWYLYVSPSASSSWGPDQLGSNVVSPGETFTVRNIPCGRNYDLKIEGSGHTTLATRYGVYFSCGDTLTWRLTGG